MIPYGRQDIRKQDIEAVLRVLKSDFLTQGETVPLFEKSLCNYTGAKYAVAVNSATSALHIACMALGLGIGDILWTAPITFVASANAGLFCGASVDFVDIDPVTFNMCTNALKQKLEEAEKLGKLPKVVMPVAMCGQSCDMKEIHSLSQRFGFKIVEDASHAIGGKYGEYPVGYGKYADISVFSFHPVKIITTGEGGAALTNNSGLAEKMTLLRSHGITRKAELMQKQNVEPWYYEQLLLGFNYRMTDIHAALGVSQLERIDEYVDKRNKLAEIYTNQLKYLKLMLPEVKKGIKSSWHLYIIQLTDEAEIAREVLFKKLRNEGIGVNVHYIPVHLQPYYQGLGFRAGDFPIAEKYYSRAVTIPLYPQLNESAQAKIIRVLKEFLS